MDKNLSKTSSFYQAENLNHLDEVGVLAQQLPVIIGLMPSIPIPVLFSMIEESTSEEFLNHFHTGITSNFTFDQLFGELQILSTPEQLLNLARKISHFDVSDPNQQDHVVILHLENNHLNNF